MIFFGIVCVVGILSLGSDALVRSLTDNALINGGPYLVEPDDPRIGHFLQNENGQTYGCANDIFIPNNLGVTNAREIEMIYYPDLVRVATSDGKEGYAYTADLGRTPSSPEEATRIGSFRQTVTVYEVDGTTPIGSMS